jgi:hypothetical protein
MTVDASLLAESFLISAFLNVRTLILLYGTSFYPQIRPGDMLFDWAGMKIRPKFHCAAGDALMK